MTGPVHALINARLLDPATNTDVMGGVLIKNGTILDWGNHITADALPDGASAEDCGGIASLPVSSMPMPICASPARSIAKPWRPPDWRQPRAG